MFHLATSKSQQRMASQDTGVTMESKRRNCKVCFHAFGSTERRPRCIPCGHTFCAKCVCDNFQDNVLLCPFCRREHHANSPLDFAVNYELEGFLFDASPSEPVSLESQSTDYVSSATISKKLKSMRTELASSLESIGVKSQDLKSQLNEYQSLMNEWKEKHRQVVQDLSVTTREHEDMIKHIEKEYNRVLQSVNEEEAEKKRMKRTRERLYAANTGLEIIPALDEADQCYDALDNWIQESQKNFPDVNLIEKSLMKLGVAEDALKMLKTKSEPEEVASPMVTIGLWSKVLTQNLPSESNDAKISHVSQKVASASVLSVHEKVHLALQKASLHKQSSPAQKDTQQNAVETQQSDASLFQDVHIQTDLLLTLRTLSRIFAVQEYEGALRYAKVTLHQDQMYLHAVTDQTPPHDAFILQHLDVRNLINSGRRRAFLEFGTGHTTLGEVVIRLFHYNKRSANFAALCMGIKGPSFVNTNIYDVSDKGNAGEMVMCGDYEFNNGKGGKAVIPGAGKKSGGDLKPKEAGCVCGLFTVTGDSGVSKFGIVTKEDASWNIPGVFGKVESGLQVLTEAVPQYPNIKTVKIINCGIIFSL